QGRGALGPRGAARAGGGAPGRARRHPRGARSPDGTHRRGARAARRGRRGRAAPRFPMPGGQSRGRYALPEGGGRRGTPHRARAEGRHRAAARAGAEHRIAERMGPPEIGRRGLLLVLSSPSGAGKTTITRSLVERDGNLSVSISATTRPPRANEIDGKDYYFV